MSEEKKNGKTKAEKFKNYALGIGACTALILGLINMVFDKSNAVEKKTDDGYEKLAKKVNELAEFSNKVQTKLAIMQAREEERRNMVIYQKLEASEKANKKLREQLDTLALGKKAKKPKASVGYARVRITSASKCKAGQVLDAGDQCRWVPRSVAAKVFVDKMAGDATKIQLDLERKRSKKLAAEKKAINRHVQAAQKKHVKPVPTKLKAL